MKKLPEERFISLDELNLHYVDWGNKANQPLILLHGLCGYAHYWDFFAHRLSQSHHIIAIDQRGHGDSDWMPSYYLNDFVIDLESFIAKLRLTDLVLIGHSLGGIIATIYASHHPDQIGQLVIVDIGPQIMTNGFKRMEAVRQDEPQFFISEDKARDYLRQIEPRQSAEFIQQFILHALKKDQNSRLIFKYDKALYKLALRSPIWLWDDLEQIICPTLVMNGQDSDLLDLKVARKMVEKLPFGSLVVIEHAGHNLLGDNPEAFCSSIENFLNTS